MSSAVTRVATVGLTGLVTACLTAAPALADNPIGPAEGADPGSGLSPVATILLFVVTPVASAVILGALVWLPGVMRANRYRPAKGWHAAPVWFAGPAEPIAAVQSAEVGDVVRGGASGSW